jgi:hypothetical protein
MSDNNEALMSELERTISAAELVQPAKKKGGAAKKPASDKKTVHKKKKDVAESSDDFDSDDSDDSGGITTSDDDEDMKDELEAADSSADDSEAEILVAELEVKPAVGKKRPRVAPEQPKKKSKSVAKKVATPPVDADVKIANAATAQRVARLLVTLGAAKCNAEMGSERMRACLVAPIVGRLGHLAVTVAAGDQGAELDLLVRELADGEPMFGVVLDANPDAEHPRAVDGVDRCANVRAMLQALVLVHLDRATLAGKTTSLEQSNILTAYLMPFYPSGPANWAAASATIEMLLRYVLAPSLVATMPLGRDGKPGSRGLQHHELTDYFNVSTRKESEIRTRIANIPSVSFFVSLLMHLHRNTARTVPSAASLWPPRPNAPFSDAFDKTKTKERAR